MEKNKKNIKLNDKKDNKKKRIHKEEKYISDEAREVRRFVIILFGIIIVILAVYGITKVLKGEEVEEETTREVVDGEINYDVVSVGTMLSRNPEEYYVLIYDAEDTQAVYYSAIISKYMTTKNAKDIYFCDLGNKFNESYKAKDEKTNPDAKKINELALGDLTLLKVKKGKINKYIEGLDTIKKELGL